MYWANQGGLEGKKLQDMYDTATVPGTIAHYLIECHLKKITPVMKAEWPADAIQAAMTAFEMFLTWCEQFKFRVIAVEPHLVSEKWQFGGTPDLIAEVMDDRSIVDWKTGKFGQYAEHWIQPEVYRVLAEENGYGPIARFDCLRIRKDVNTPGFDHIYRRFPFAPEVWGVFERLLYIQRAEKFLKQLA